MFGFDRLFEHLVGVEGDEREEVDERGEPDDVEQRADARGQVGVDRVDAHMDAMHQRDGAAPRARHRKRVAGKLVGAADA